MHDVKYRDKTTSWYQDTWPPPTGSRSSRRSRHPDWTEAVREKRQFNIVHPASGMKVDVIVRKPDAFDRSRFSRKRILRVFPDLPAAFASQEDVIIKKMEYFRDGGSEKHLRDVVGILKVSGDQLDLEYIDRWAVTKDLTDIWKAVRSRGKPR